VTKLEPFRPSNGTSGDIFCAQWCDMCQKERAYRENPDHESGCEILSATLIQDIDDEDYPKEWVYGPSGPMCTAFQPETDETWPWAMIPDQTQMELPL
jgi:hypothetical protein